MKSQALMLTSIVALAAGAAHAEILVGSVIGTTEEEIVAALEAEGYAIDEIEVEGDIIEVEALKGAEEIEFEISMADGTVLEVESEEEDDDDDEDDDD